MVGSIIPDSAWAFFGSRIYRVRGSVSEANVFSLAVWLGQCCTCSEVSCLSVCVVTTGI